MIWDDNAYFFKCKIDGEMIHENYVLKGEEFGVLAVSNELCCSTIILPAGVMFSLNISAGNMQRSL